MWVSCKSVTNQGEQKPLSTEAVKGIFIVKADTKQRLHEDVTNLED
jgi:hypothetical protein